MERKMLLTAFGYGLLGLVLGIYMAASKNHGQLVTHAHIMLLGFVVSFVYAVCYRLWLQGYGGGLGTAQFWTHQVGTLGVTVGLFLLYGRYVPYEAIDPVLAVASIIALVGFVLMKVMLIKATKT